MTDAHTAMRVAPDGALFAAALLASWDSPAPVDFVDADFASDDAVAALGAGVLGADDGETLWVDV
ncbi:MAG TPA: hypothetical protein VL068_00450 [Microthrixaceae bacterium]|nr:hypothetical protein [Microthrixaceae bacterium]